MRRRARSSATAALLLCLLTACTPASTPARKSPHPEPPSKTMSVSADGSVISDMPYVDDKNPRHALDLYLPAERENPVPLMIWVHGGGWRLGDKSDADRGLLPVRRLRDDLLKHGIAVASINYRLLPRAQFPEPIRDVSSAVRRLADRADEYGLDPARFALAGDSAGAYLAGMVAFLPQADPLNDLASPGAVTVKAFLGYYGSYAFAERARQARAQGCRNVVSGRESSYGKLLGLDPESPESRSTVDRASVISYARAGSPETLLFHGTKDCIVPHAQSTSLHDRLRDVGATPRLVTSPLGHADPRFFTDDELRRTAVDFLVEQLAR